MVSRDLYEWTEPGSPQRYDTVLPGRAAGIDRALSTPEEPVWRRKGESSMLFTRLPTAPVWSPSAHEEVSVMQNSQREAWNCLGSRFSRAHSAGSPQPSDTSPHHTNAHAVHPDRRKSVAYGCHSGDSPQRVRQSRRGSLPAKADLALRPTHPDQRQRTPSSLRPPAVAVVRGSPLGSARPGQGSAGTGVARPRHMFSRQMRRVV
ncbi:hypothetical protein T484DRAFT_1746960 [Baffinella frigidus]|nr:hypothetical protein T484DRAFT_1746960 [Cryptophyta sp. CCMP2293]